ncbi:MAG: hypothetical protein AB8E15_11820 [Bdellovibrionales bacterium]
MNFVYRFLRSKMAISLTIVLFAVYMFSLVLMKKQHDSIEKLVKKINLEAESTRAELESIKLEDSFPEMAITISEKTLKRIRREVTDSDWLIYNATVQKSYSDLIDFRFGRIADELCEDSIDDGFKYIVTPDGIGFKNYVTYCSHYWLKFRIGKGEVREVDYENFWAAYVRLLSYGSQEMVEAAESLYIDLVSLVSDHRVGGLSYDQKDPYSKFFKAETFKSIQFLKKSSHVWVLSENEELFNLWVSKWYLFCSETQSIADSFVDHKMLLKTGSENFEGLEIEKAFNNLLGKCRVEIVKKDLEEKYKILTQALPPIQAKWDLSNRYKHQNAIYVHIFNKLDQRLKPQDIVY